MNEDPRTPKAEPVPVPDSDRETAPLCEYLALLHRCEDLRRDLEEARETGRRAGDRAWACVAERLFEFAGGWRAESDEMTALQRKLAGLWEEEKIEFCSATGQRVDRIDPEEFEVMGVTPAERPEDDGLIVETFRPLIRRDGRVLLTGRIIVARRAGIVEHNAEDMP